MDECDSRGELGDMGDCIVAGGGAENQDQEARAQRCRRKHGVRSARTRATTSARSVRYYYTRNIYIYITFAPPPRNCYPVHRTTVK